MAAAAAAAAGDLNLMASQSVADAEKAVIKLVQDFLVTKGAEVMV